MQKDKRPSTLAAAFLISILMAQTISAGAEQVSFALGSYKLSFDLSTADECRVVIAKPIYSATFSGILYTGYGAQVLQAGPPHNLITVVIMQYKRPISLGSEVEATKRLLSDSGGCGKVVTAERVIDGHRGYLTNSSKCENGTRGFVAQYMLDGAKGSGEAECLIASTYPWEEGTLSLLNTIHIEKQSGR